MNKTVTQARCPPKPADELWQSIPLDLILSALAIVLAAALHLAGLMP